MKFEIKTNVDEFSLNFANKIEEIQKIVSEYFEKKLKQFAKN